MAMPTADTSGLCVYLSGGDSRGDDRLCAIGVGKRAGGSTDILCGYAGSKYSTHDEPERADVKYARRFAFNDILRLCFDVFVESITPGM